MEILGLVRKNKVAVALLALAGVWLLFRHSVSAWLCQGAQVCFLYPDYWPQLLGVTANSSPVLIGLLSGVLFALPFGRAGLLATLVGIQLAQPVFGLIGVILIFVLSSAISIIAVHSLVEYGLNHSKAAWIRARLKPAQILFSPSIRKNGVAWLSAGNLVSSQWHMSALGILCGVSRPKIWLGLFMGNLAGFALVYAFSKVPNLDAVSIVLLTLAVAIALSSPAVWTNWRNSKKK
ncbi:hypothetical protein HY993_03545 [Candidatus Micrarchaeota archaeon]|nr:hypothetical protein [Candidatus Micrarchaeota archaeon]